MKKIISVILSVITILNIFCALGITVSAESTYTYKDYEYEIPLYNTNVKITKYNGSETVVTIPRIIHKNTVNYTVTNIGDRAFSGCKNITNITIPDSVTTIGDSAFGGCSSLATINIPENVKSIGSRTFGACTNLTDIKVDINNSNYSSINGNLYNKDKTKLIYYAEGKKDDSFSIPNSVTCIGERAFGITNLTSITIPSSVTNIESSAFMFSHNLKDAIYQGYKSDLFIAEENNQSLTKVIRYTKDKGSFNNGEWFFDYTNGVLMITGNGNMEFGNNQSVPWSAYKNEINSVVIESGITSISDYAFANCPNLNSATIPNTVISIGESAFESCEADIIIPRNVSYIAENAFYGCKNIQSITFTNNVFIGDGAFTDCTSLKNVDFFSSVDAIGDNAFSNCTSLENITIPKCDSPLGESAFSGCTNLSKIEIQNGLTAIEGSAFYGCSSLKIITIPDSVESIGKEAFGDCKNLTSVTIGSGCKSIASKAFWDCPNLKKVTIKYPNCIFSDSQYAISTTAVICGYKNSTAYTYARSYMRSFEDIEAGVRYGWIDGSFVEIKSEDNPTEPTSHINEPIKPTESTETQSSKINISKWNVSGIENKSYTGKVIKQDNILVSKDGEYADFSVNYKNNLNVGKATVTIKGSGAYTGTIIKYFTISKAKNTIKVTAKKTVKANAKKTTTIKKAITVKNAQGKVTYKTNNKKVAVKSGTMTVAKGFKEGKTIKVKITITAKGNTNYKSKTVTKTVKLRIK